MPQVSLQEVLVDITRTHPAILEAYENYKSVVAERDIATSGYFPQIGTQLTTGPEYTKGVPTNDEEMDLNATTATLYARQNLFQGWKTQAYVDETDARIQAAAFEVLNVANRVYLETAESYIGVVKSKALLQIAQQNALTQERIMRQVREKTDAGFNRVSELYNSESRLALSKGSYISRQQDLNQAMTRFHRQFGRLLQAEQFVEPAPQFQPPDSVEDSVASALANHPALKVAKYNMQTRRHTYEMAKADYWPSLDLELRGQYRDDTGGEEGDTTQAGAYLSLSYLFWDGGQRSGVKARDQQSLRKEQQRAYIERRNVNESVRLAWNILEAEAAKSSYLVEHVLLSGKTLQAFKEEYYAGRRTLLDLLNMENEFTDAKLTRTDSEFSSLVALYRLMQATGQLLAEHDTGLRETLALSANQAEDLAGYELVAFNRDQDGQEDEQDQCDNSALGDKADQSGCIEVDVAKTGYLNQEELQLGPYIAPETPEVVPSAPVVPTQPQVVETVRLQAQPNSDNVTSQAIVDLAALSERLLADPVTTVLVEGYIASDRASAENTALSERRAGLVAQYLVEQGVAAERITVVGRGNENPLAANDTPEGRQMNRRIEVTVIAGQ